MRSLLLVFFSFVVTTLSAGGRDNFILEKDLAQYKGSDYANVVRVERRISLNEAITIADNDPNIDYFVYLKGWSMVLEVPPGVKVDSNNDPFHLLTYTPFIYDSGDRGEGYCRLFGHGDVVFFKKEGIWLGSAPGLADTYFKRTSFPEKG